MRTQSVVYLDLQTFDQFQTLFPDQIELGFAQIAPSYAALPSLLSDLGIAYLLFVSLKYSIPSRGGFE